MLIRNRTHEKKSLQQQQQFGDERGLACQFTETFALLSTIMLDYVI